MKKILLIVMLISLPVLFSSCYTVVHVPYQERDVVYEDYYDEGEAERDVYYDYNVNPYSNWGSSYWSYPSWRWRYGFHYDPWYYGSMGMWGSWGFYDPWYYGYNPYYLGYSPWGYNYSAWGWGSRYGYYGSYGYGSYGNRYGTSYYVNDRRSFGRRGSDFANDGVGLHRTITRTNNSPGSTTLSKQNSSDRRGQTGVRNVSRSSPREGTAVRSRPTSRSRVGSTNKTTSSRPRSTTRSTPRRSSSSKPKSRPTTTRRSTPSRSTPKSYSTPSRSRSSTPSRSSSGSRSSSSRGTSRRRSAYNNSSLAPDINARISSQNYIVPKTYSRSFVNRTPSITRVSVPSFRSSPSSVRSSGGSSYSSGTRSSGSSASRSSGSRSAKRR